MPGQDSIGGATFSAEVNTVTDFLHSAVREPLINVWEPFQKLCSILSFYTTTGLKNWFMMHEGTFPEFIQTSSRRAIIITNSSMNVLKTVKKKSD